MSSLLDSIDTNEVIELYFQGIKTGALAAQQDLVKYKLLDLDQDQPIQFEDWFGKLEEEFGKEAQEEVIQIRSEEDMWGKNPPRQKTFPKDLKLKGITTKALAKGYNACVERWLSEEKKTLYRLAKYELALKTIFRDASEFLSLFPDLANAAIITDTTSLAKRAEAVSIRLSTYLDESSSGKSIRKIAEFFNPSSLREIVSQESGANMEKCISSNGEDALTQLLTHIERTFPDSASQVAQSPPPPSRPDPQPNIGMADPNCFKPYGFN